MRCRLATSFALWAVMTVLVAGAAVVSCSRQPEPAGKKPPNPSQAAPSLAHVKAEWPQLVVDVVEAARSGASLTIRFRFTNAGPGAFDFGDRFASEPADRDSLADVALLEPSGLRKYFVLRDRSNRPACSTGLSPLRPGETRELFVRFPAPPPGASRITILVPHVPEIRDVPVGNRDQMPGTGV
jgi:hypothetical protein